MSIEELQARIEALKAEIARVEAHMQRAQTTAPRPKSCSRSHDRSGRSAADSLCTR